MPTLQWARLIFVRALASDMPTTLGTVQVGDAAPRLANVAVTA